MSPIVDTLTVDRKRLALWIAALFLLVGATFVAWSYVGTFVLGLFAYYVTRPLFRRIHARFKSRTVATAVSLLLVTVPVLLLVFWTVGLVVQQLGAVITTDSIISALGPIVDVPTVTGAVNDLVDEVARDPTVLTRGPLADQLGQLTGSLGDLLDVTVVSFGFVATVGLHAFIALVLTFFLLRDDYRVVDWYRTTFTDGRDIVTLYAQAVDEDLHSIFFGNILNALLTGVLAVLTYSLLNLVAPAGLVVPRPVLVGILVGIGSLVPVVGIKVVWVPIALYLFVVAAITDPAALWFVVVFALVSVVIVDTIPDQVLRPFVSGRNLNIGAVMLAYTFGPLFFGWYGIFLGPLLLVVAYEFVRIVVPWLVDPGRLDDIAAAVEEAVPRDPVAVGPVAPPQSSDQPTETDAEES